METTYADDMAKLLDEYRTKSDQIVAEYESACTMLQKKLGDAEQVKFIYASRAPLRRSTSMHNGISDADCIVSLDLPEGACEETEGIDVDRKAHSRSR